MAQWSIPTWNRVVDARIRQGGGASSFELQIGAFVARAKANMDEVLRKACFDMFGEIINMSPVRTGRFRGNWQLGINAPVRASLVAVDPSGGGAKARIHAGLENVHVGQVVYLSNNLTYARRLEYGWSLQAPAGMVRVTVARWQAFVDQAARSLPSG